MNAIDKTWIPPTGASYGCGKPAFRSSGSACSRTAKHMVLPTWAVWVPARLATLARPAAVIMLGCVGIAALSGCGRSQSHQKAALPVVVRVVEVIPESSKESARYTGVVRARTESSLGFRVAGKVTERLVDAGEAVTNGQPLLRLDPVDFDLALRAAQASVEAARAVHTQASLELDRLRGLVEKRAESRDALEKATAAAGRSAATLHAAEAQAVQIANQASYATLYADSDGIVMTTLAEPGQVVSAGQPVVVLAKDGLREAAVDIPESSLEQVREQAATAQLYLDQTVTVPATLREISGVADPLSRTYQARYVLQGEPTRFPLGATVTVRVAPTGEAAQPMTEIPLGSLIDRGDGAAVWVVDPATSTLQKRAVTIAKLGAETASIGQGLRQGDLVVSLGAHLLNAGEVVRMEKLAAKEAK